MAYPKSVVPAAFRSKKSLERINIAAVGLAMASLTAMMFSMVWSSRADIPLITGLPTLLWGVLWARVLRWEKTVPGTPMRWGWLLSILLAALNGGTALGLMIAKSGNSSPLETVWKFFGGMLLGMTFGAIAWIPGLLAVLALFGVPIAWAQKQAARGLEGQERGEGVVGAASAALSALALLLSLKVMTLSGATGLHVMLMQALGAMGMLLGGTAMVTARERHLERQRFVDAVERGEVEHFRVDATDEGKVLVRVVSQGQGYRVRDYEEEIAALDASGAVTRTAKE